MAFENIHNVYEKLVLEHITETLIQEQGINDESFLEDVACIALNQLPTHYVRFDVDNAFYMTDKETSDMIIAIKDAVKHAHDFVRKHERRND